MIKNRARTFPNQVTASRTRYFAATDAQTLRLLSPIEIKSGDPVRQVEIFIELQKPITMSADAGKPAYVGTAIIEAPSTLRQVHSSIFVNGLTVIGK